MNQRMCISEHPFGTIKRILGAACFLLKGKRKVSGEFALMAIGYNKRRLSSLRCKNYFVILVGMIYAVAHIDMI